MDDAAVRVSVSRMHYANCVLSPGLLSYRFAVVLVFVR